jgi:hypothetical protein
MVLDSFGNLFVANNCSEIISKTTPGSLTMPFFGSNGLSNDCNLLVIDSSDNIFSVNRVESNVVTKYFPNGTYIDFANFSNNVKTFIIDSSNNMYLAIPGGVPVRKITPSGVSSNVTTLTGGGFMVRDSLGNFFTAGDNNAGFFRMYKTEPNGTTNYAFVNDCYANQPMQIDSNNNIYWHNAININNNSIKKVTPSGVVTTIVSLGNIRATAMTIDSSNNLYYVTINSSGVPQTPICIWKVSPSGVVTGLGYNPNLIGYLLPDNLGYLYMAHSTSTGVTKFLL